LYFAQQPVPPKYFADRKDVLEDLLSILQNCASTKIAENAVISGDRGTGKTSLLYKLIESTPKDCLAILVALSTSQNPETFVELLLQKIQIENWKTLRRPLRFLYKVYERVEEFSIAQISVKIREKKLSPELGLLHGLLKLKNKFQACFILIDEADLLSPESLALIKNTIEQIRSLHGYPVSMILAGKEDVSRRLTGKWSPVRRFFTGHKHRISTLDSEGVSEALTSVAQSLDVEWSDPAVAYVRERSRCHPYIVQIYGERTIQVLRALKRNRIEVETVKKAESDVIDDVWSWYADYTDGVPNSTEERALLTLANIGNGTSKDNLNLLEFGSELEALAKRHWIELDEDTQQYYFSHEIIRECIVNNFLRRLDVARGV
jgi:GTPase SAR1 family protein